MSDAGCYDVVLVTRFSLRPLLTTDQLVMAHVSDSRRAKAEEKRLRSCRSGRRDNHRQRVNGAVRLALLEVALDLCHLVGDVGEA